MRQLKQVGVDYVLSGGGPIPWTEADLRALMDRFQAGGLTLCNLMISGFSDVIYGLPGRDEQIDLVIQSIRVAGKVGLPVIEYNFYANRLIEGYKEEMGRAGAGYTAYDYALSKDLPPKDDIGTFTRGYNCEELLPKISCPILLIQADPNVPGLTVLTDHEIERAQGLNPRTSTVRIEGEWHALGTDSWNVIPLVRAISLFIEAN